MSLSLVSNTYNEESNLRALFHCVSKVVDEIIIVDTGSTDHTRELARKLGARVYEIPGVPGFGPMRTLTHHLARTDWTLLLDGDERMLPQDAAKLPEFCKMDYDVIWLPRHHYRSWDMSVVENPDLRVHPDWQSRLVRNNRKAQWVRKVHEKLTGVDDHRQLRDIGAPIIRHFGWLKTEERLQFIKDTCDRLWKDDEEYADTYVLEKRAGSANGAGYWKEVQEKAYVG